jgi:hypothetical protein
MLNHDGLPAIQCRQLAMLGQRLQCHPGYEIVVVE